MPSPHSLAAILSPSTPAESNISTAGVSRASTPKRAHSEAFSPPEQPYLHPNSPDHNRSGQSSAPSPSTFGSSGLPADEGSGGGLRGGQEEKKKMARSSIACARCRRSKVKCVNNGPDSKCKSCEASGRECTYPSPSGLTTTPKRAEPSTGVKADEGENKKRVRKTDDGARRHSHRSGEDALNSPVLTAKTWTEVYQIFNQNFSTEMSFLHYELFRDCRQVTTRDVVGPAITDHEGARLLLLGVLALTAQYHPGLVQHHSPNHPIGASEYFASALVNSNGLSGYHRLVPSLRRTQALLMLTLHEWGQAKGTRAWVHLGDAIRLAELMHLPFEDDVDRNIKDEKEASSALTSTEKEIRRRTMWSCFIMDSMLSAGKYRIKMIQLENMKLQLPRYNDAFSFVRKGPVEYLDDDFITPDSGNSDDEVLSRYIRVVDLWGSVYKWSSNGGRRKETVPPWDEKSTFHRLSQRLGEFDAALPKDLKFTQEHLTAYFRPTVHNGSTYVLMHTLRLLCLVLLHREWVPYAPILCNKPVGPLDEPTFPPDKYDIPDGFWEESAEILFKSGRDIVEIIKTSLEREDAVLPQSTLIVQALYIAAFTGVYSNHFPHMDTRRYMCRPDQDMEPGGDGYSGMTIKILKEMSHRSQMATHHLLLTKDWNEQFKKTKLKFELKAGEASGGGLQEYMSLERELNDLGNLDINRGSPDESIDSSRGKPLDGPPSSSDGDAMQGVDSLSLPRLNGNGPTWATVNMPNQSAEAEDRARSNAQGASGFPYGYQSSQPSPNTNPRLTHPSSGDSRAGLPSPYGHGRLPDINTHGGSYQRASQQIILPPMQHSKAAMAPPSTQSVHSAPPGYSFLMDSDMFPLVKQEEAICSGLASREDFSGIFSDGWDHVGEPHRSLIQAWENY